MIPALQEAELDGIFVPFQFSNSIIITLCVPRASCSAITYDFFSATDYQIGATCCLVLTVIMVFEYRLESKTRSLSTFCTAKSFTQKRETCFFVIICIWLCCAFLN